MKKKFINPFIYIGSYHALLYGLAFILIISWIASLTSLHFNGVIDIHFGGEAPIWLFFVENLLNVLIISVLFYISGLIWSISRIRFIDVIGTQFFARIPMIIPALISLSHNPEKVLKYFLSTLLERQIEISVSAIDLTVFTIFAFLILFSVIWMITLMYNAFIVSLNMKGGFSIFVFILVLIISESIIQLLNYYVFNSFISNNPLNLILQSHH